MEPRGAPADEEDCISDFAISRDSRTLVVACGLIRVYDLSRDRPPRLIRAWNASDFRDGYLGALALSPSGREIAVAYRHITGPGEDNWVSVVKVIALRNGRPLSKRTVGAGRITALAYSPDGRVLMVGKANGRLQAIVTKPIRDRTDHR